MKKTFGVNWKPPHGLYEAAAIVPRSSKASSAEESQDIVEVDALLEIPQSQVECALSKSQTTEAKRIVKEAASMRKQVDAILAEQQSIPNDCKTIVEEKVLPQRRVITRPGGSSKDRVMVVEETAARAPVIVTAIPPTPVVEQPVNTVIGQPVLPSTNTRPPKLRTLTKAEAAKVRESLQNLQSIPQLLQRESSKPASSPPPPPPPVPLVAAQVVEISGKKFSISISGPNVKVTPLDKVDDFRQVVRVGDQIRIVGNSLKVTGVTQFNMYLEPRIKR